MPEPNALHTAWDRVKVEHLEREVPILSPYHVLRFCPYVACIARVPGRSDVVEPWGSYVACPPPRRTA